ncbi:MAG TPA: hypothetical protein VFP73_07695, partial [Terrabacter sp.]|nr:hypothetical protein [Terrabacter sp.]
MTGSVTAGCEVADTLGSGVAVPVVLGSGVGDTVPLGSGVGTVSVGSGVGVGVGVGVTVALGSGVAGAVTPGAGAGVVGLVVPAVVAEETSDGAVVELPVGAVAPRTGSDPVEPDVAGGTEDAVGSVVPVVDARLSIEEGPVPVLAVNPTRTVASAPLDVGTCALVAAPGTGRTRLWASEPADPVEELSPGDDARLTGALTVCETGCATCCWLASAGAAETPRPMTSPATADAIGGPRAVPDSSTVPPTAAAAGRAAAATGTATAAAAAVEAVAAAVVTEAVAAAVVTEAVAAAVVTEAVAAAVVAVAAAVVAAAVVAAAVVAAAVVAAA